MTYPPYTYNSNNDRQAYLQESKNLAHYDPVVAVWRKTYRELFPTHPQCQHCGVEHATNSLCHNAVFGQFQLGPYVIHVSFANVVYLRGFVSLMEKGTPIDSWRWIYVDGDEFVYRHITVHNSLPSTTEHRLPNNLVTTLVGKELLGKIESILKGIDSVASEVEGGWWETSTRAEFGAEKLLQIQEMLSG